MNAEVSAVPSKRIQLNTARENDAGPLRKRSGLLAEYWYVGAMSRDVTRNNPVSTVIMETRMVLWRSKSGKVSALRDRCSHRNTMLSEGYVNNKKNCIVCPYHGWEFDSEGDCTKVPSENREGKQRNNRSIESFPVIERDGLIWLWMGLEKVPDPEKSPFKLPYYNKEKEGWGNFQIINDFENDVTNLVENFMDVPHTVIVHSGWFRNRAHKKVNTTMERTDDSVLVTYHQTGDVIGFAERVINPKKLPLYHTDKFYMPNNTRVDYGFGNNERGFVVTSTSTPISDMKTRVYTSISYKLGVLNFGAKAWLPWYVQNIINQDLVITRNQAQSLREEPANYKSTPADMLHVFIESLRKWEESGRKGRKPRAIAKEVEFWI